MKKMERVVGKVILCITICAMIFSQANVAEASVKWENGTDTGYWWGASGNISILKINDTPAYCVQPDAIIESINGYVESTPTFTEEQWKRLILIAHFGYNKTKGTNADFAATQVMLWRQIWIWKGFTPVPISNSNIPNISGRIEAIEKSIDAYEMMLSNMPLFQNAKAPIEVIEGKEQEILDVSGAIGKYPYEIVSTPKGIEASIDREKNSIVILADKESQKEASLVLRLTFDNSLFKNRFYYHTTSQNTASIGYLEELEMRVNLKVNKEGEIRIIKRSTSGQVIEGAIFQIKNLQTGVSKEYVTDEKGEVITEKIEAGKYEVVEKYVPKPYILDEKPQEIEVVPGEIGEVIFENNKPKGEFIITKYNMDKSIKLKGAKYTIWSGSKEMNGDEVSFKEEIITDSTGNARLENLELGKYYYQEIEAPPGYVRDEKTYEFDIEYVDSSTALVKVVREMVNEEVAKEKEVVKTGDDFKGGWAFAGIITAMCGSWILIRAKKKR